MASNKFLTAIMAVSATVSVAAFAGCTPPGPVPAPSGSKSPTPTTSGQPSPTTSAQPTPGSSVGATATPTPIPTNADTSQKATIHGVVYDDTLQRLSGVTVTGKVLGGGTFAAGSDTLTTTTQVGSWALNGTPTGETVLVTVSKSGFTTRQQTIVPLANLTGDPSANKLDFGTDNANGSQVFAMSDKPEVTTMTPAADATGVDPATSFTLTWSEPVNTADVQDYFAVAVSDKKYTLTEGTAIPNTAAKIYVPANDNFNGTAQTANAEVIYQSTAAFDFAWSNNNATVTVTWRPGNKLPTDKDANKLPQYAIGFSGSVRDAAGSGTRSDRYFRTSPAQIGKNGYRFTVAADTTAPSLVGITAVNNSATNASNDQVRYQFSETMLLYPSNATKASIPDVANNGYPLTAGNYEFTQTSVKPTAFGAGTAMTAVVLYDADATRATIVGNHNAANGFEPGNDVYGGVDTDVLDPAGNTIVTSNVANEKGAKAI